MGYTFATVDELGDNYGFRRVRKPLGITAFGANLLVYPPGAEGVFHYHDEQDELYFIHSGTARFEVDGETREVGAGGMCHVEAATPRRVSNAGDDDLVMLVIGAKDGYVGRDGQLVDIADLEKRQALSQGEFSKSD
jgi:mannose-6-phosphate isomerase-like protein (cupin superfamily)